MSNVQKPFQRLKEKGLRCRLEKCFFAQSSVEHLSFNLSKEGISKGRNVDAVINMPAPKNVSDLKSFLGQLQFYSKFLQNLSTVVEPLSLLTRKNIPWKWEAEEGAAFKRVNDLLCTDTVLTHFDQSLPVGVSCYASNVGIGAVRDTHSNTEKLQPNTERSLGYNLRPIKVSSFSSWKTFHSGNRS